MKRTETISENITIHLGDCKEIIPMLQHFDAVVSDPPYGIEGTWSGGNSHGWGRHRGEAAKWDKRPDWIVDWLNCLDIPKIIWGGQYFSLPPSGSWLFWDKVQRGVSFGEGEMAWTNLGKPIRAFDFGAVKIVSENKEHPTQKPLELMKWCLKQLPASAKTVLDPFMGAGTTGAAAAKTGRGFIGIEIEEKYFDIACRRIADALRQPDMFTEHTPEAEQLRWDAMWEEPFYKNAAE